MKMRRKKKGSKEREKRWGEQNRSRAAASGVATQAEEEEKYSTTFREFNFLIHFNYFEEKVFTSSQKLKIKFSPCFFLKKKRGSSYQQRKK